MLDFRSIAPFACRTISPKHKPEIFAEANVELSIEMENVFQKR